MRGPGLWASLICTSSVALWHPVRAGFAIGDAACANHRHGDCDAGLSVAQPASHAGLRYSAGKLAKRQRPLVLC
jgi:hypothetical protein